MNGGSVGRGVARDGSVGVQLGVSEGIAVRGAGIAVGGSGDGEVITTGTGVEVDGSGVRGVAVAVAVADSMASAASADVAVGFGAQLPPEAQLGGFPQAAASAPRTASPTNTARALGLIMKR